MVASGDQGGMWEVPGACLLKRLRPAHTEIGSATRASEHRVRAGGCRQQLQNRAVTGVDFSIRGCSAPEYARIATTLASARPAHGAATIEVVRGERRAEIFSPLISETLSRKIAVTRLSIGSKIILSWSS